MLEKREGKVHLSVWVDEGVIRLIDDRVSQLRRKQLGREHGSDVIREVLRTWKDAQAPCVKANDRSPELRLSRA